MQLDSACKLAAGVRRTIGMWLNGGLCCCTPSSQLACSLLCAKQSIRNSSRRSSGMLTSVCIHMAPINRTL